jgi:hypothetical protein
MSRRHFAIPVISTTLSYAVALLLALAIQRWQWPALQIYILGFIGILAATISAVVVEQKHKIELQEELQSLENKLRKSHEEHVKSKKEFCEENIKEVLEYLTITVIPNVSNMRANIFLEDPTKKELYIAYHFGMDDSPDLNIRLAPNVGCAGYAWVHGEISVADLSQSTDQNLKIVWKFTIEQIILSNHLKAILAVPIFHPRDHNRVVAVYNLDSTEPISKYFDKPEIQQHAQQVAVLLGAFLWLGNVISE